MNWFAFISVTFLGLIVLVFYLGLIANKVMTSQDEKISNILKGKADD